MNQPNEMWPNNPAEEILTLVQNYESSSDAQKQFDFDIEHLETILNYYFDNAEFIKAAAVADNGIAMNPFESTFYIAKGHISIITRKFDEAEFNLNKADTLDPNNFETLMLRGHMAKWLGDADFESYYLLAVKNCEPEQLAWLYFSIGNNFISDLEFEKAIGYYKQSLSYVDPEIEEMSLAEISICYNEGDATEGIEFYKNYIESKPYAKMAWLSLSVLYNKEELFELSLQASDYATIIDEQFHEAWFQKGLALLNLNQNNAAYECFEAARSLTPNNAMYNFHLGMVTERMGESKTARKWYNKTLALDSFFSDAYYGIALTYLIEENFVQSIKYIEKAIAIDNQSAEYWGLLGNALQFIDEYDMALQALEQCLRLQPAFMEVRLSLGSLLIDLNKPEQALPLLEEGLVLHNNLVEYIYRLAAILLDTGFAKEATTYLETALSLNFEKHNLFMEFSETAIYNDHVMNLIEAYKYQ